MVFKEQFQGTWGLRLPPENGIFQMSRQNTCSDVFQTLSEIRTKESVNQNISKQPGTQLGILEGRGLGNKKGIMEAPLNRDIFRNYILPI